MELLEGEDLEQHLERHGPMPSTELAALALPLVAALAAAHDAGVIHRDLKPGNIFLARGFSERVPKILDFGISKLSSSTQPAGLAVTAFDQLLGSPLYLPPEALQGSRELTARSDQYSLGVVLYECVTGQAPFFREDLVPLLTAISEGSCEAPRQLRPETPLPLERAILRAMSVDPRQRFEHIRDLGRALLEVADLRTRHVWAPLFLAPGVLGPAAAPATAAMLAPLPALPSRPARRNSSARRGPLGAVCLLVAGVALLVLAVGRMREEVSLTVQQPALALARQGAVVPSESAPHPVAVQVESESEPVAASPAEETLVVATPAAGAEPTASESALTESAAADPASPEASAAEPPKARKRRASGERARGSDTERELRDLFFPAGGAREKGSRERAARRPTSGAPSGVNEAPFFD
jgi:serine/threonine-protein kinase